MKTQLELLRDENLELQQRLADLQKRHDILQAESHLQNGKEFGSSFAERLVNLVYSLYGSDLYSDLDILTDSQSIRGHRLVIASRTDYWGDLSDKSKIDFQTTYDIASTIIQWIYTDKLDENKWGVLFLLEVLKVAHKFELDELAKRCESSIITQLEVNNCIKIYQEAGQLKLQRLTNACADFIAASWNLFEPEHFTEMDAELLFDLLKSHCKHILHATIRLKRSDVMLLFLSQNEASIEECVNEADELDQLPLDLSLNARLFDTAKILCEHGADVNRIDKRGKTFIAKAIEAGNVEACEFLVENGAKINYVNETNGETLIHTLAKSASVESKIEEWSKRNIHLFDLNARDKKGRTALFVAIAHKNKSIFDLLIGQGQVNVNVADSDGHTPLEGALFESKNTEMASELVKRGANINSKDANGNTLLILAIQRAEFAAIQFLAKHQIDVNVKNKKGTTALHFFLFSLPLHGRINEEQLDILKVLLKSGGDSTLVDDASGQTAIHFAVQRDQAVLNCILKATTKTSLLTLDQEGRSPLWCALTASKLEAAQSLVNAGADVNESSDKQDPLLIRSINLKRDDIVQFLLQNRADTTVKNKDGCGAFNLAVEQGLTSTVHELCRQGTNLNAINPRNGFVPLWTALAHEDYGTAQVLIAHGCDLEAWNEDEEGVKETLLHKAIDERNEKIAIFLIKNGCDVNATRKYSNHVDSTLETPLQMAVKWGMSEVAKVLISNLKCKTEAQDSEGRTASHICLMEQDHPTLDLLLGHPNPAAAFTLRDKYGQTPLSIALKNRDNKAAEAICKRMPHALVQVNGNGENLLHLSVKSNDFESVLFMLALQIDVNIPINDQTRLTNLHIAAEYGDSEIILRNLLVAGARINEKDTSGRSALFVAAGNNKPEICKILLENSADANLADSEGNTCLHSAVSHGCVKIVELLLNESDVNILAANNLQRNAIHLTANVQGILGAELFQTIIEIHPNYPLEQTDVYGNTVFLLAFINGNEELCRLALKYNVCLGTSNHQNDTIFRINTPTKQLLFGLLNGLDREPRWAEGEFCSECESKFTLTMRKHHCRHCGRLICQKCSEQIPILKYNLQKPVRVCHVCYDVLTIGTKELNE